MKMRFNDPITDKIGVFLNEIGIPVVGGKVPEDAFLPGVFVEDGGLVVDEAKLRYPGDLLHEAGHLAFATAEQRRGLSGEVLLPDLNIDVIEVQAICWSYAACLHLNIEPSIVFHPDGYHGRSESILFNFSMGIYIGLPGLESAGMAYGERQAAIMGIEPFPVMQKWLSD